MLPIYDNMLYHKKNNNPGGLKLQKITIETVLDFKPWKVQRMLGI